MALLIIEEPTAGNTQEKAEELPIIGIDFGTTNSLVGIVVNDEVRFFKDKNGNELHRSIVSFDKNGELNYAGNEAGESDCKIKISSIKRLLGKGFDDVKNKQGQYDFGFEKSEDGELKIVVGEKSLRVEEITAQILRYLKELALSGVSGEKTAPHQASPATPLIEGNLTEAISHPAGDPTTGGTAEKEKIKAVITVPAYFDEAAKNAVKLSAGFAGIEVVRLVNEPTAAALAYGLETGKEGIYAVYDLGGGTFDVSILKMQKGVFKALGVSGDNELGGDDIDEAISTWLISKNPTLSANSASFNEKYGFSSEKIGDFKEISLIDVAKLLKEKFSSENELKFTINDTDLVMNKVEFEEIITPLIERTINITKDLIEELELEIGDQKNEIKGIVLVGGSSRIELIKKKLAEIFGAAKIFSDHDPDCVVAQGAVLQAYNLSGGGDSLLLDVLPLSLGVEMMGGIVDKIIARNTTIPISMAKEFTTYADNQTGLKLHIVQGEREFSKDCRSLADFEVKGIPAMRAGMARVLVTFKVDADGLLTVTAKEETTGEIQEIQVKPTYGLDENQVKHMLIDSMQNAKEDMAARLLAEAIREAKQNIDFMIRDLAQYPDMVSDDEKALIEEKMVELAALAGTSQNKDDIADKQKEMEDASEEFILKKVSKTLEVYVDRNIDDAL